MQRSALAAGEGGIWVAASSRYTRLPHTNDIYTSTSLDDGQTWGAPSLAMPGSGTFRGPKITTDGAGTWMLVAVSGPRIDASVSTSAGLLWSEPSPTLLEHGGDDSNLYLLLDSFVVFARGPSRFAVLAATKPMAPGSTGADVDVLIASTDDAGLTWSPAKPVAGYAKGRLEYPGGSEDSRPVAARTADGYVAAWASSETLRHAIISPNGKDIGPDQDILFARGSDLCADEPQPDCRRSLAPDASSLKIQKSDRGRSSFDWKWRVGEATSIEEFADPTNGTEYSICVYDSVGGIPRLAMELHAPDDAMCLKGACWRGGTRTFKYGDGAVLSGGLRALSLTAGADRKAAIRAGGFGPGLGIPELPLAMDPDVRIQLVRREDASCWETIFDTAVQNDAKRFLAGGD